MKINELLESRYADPEKFAYDMYDLMKEYSLYPDLVSLRLRKDQTLATDVEAHIVDVNFEDDQPFFPTITKILTTMYGDPSTFKIKQGAKPDVGWRIGPYFLLPTIESSDDNYETNVGDLLIISIEKMVNHFKDGKWL